MKQLTLITTAAVCLFGTLPAALAVSDTRAVQTCQGTIERGGYNGYKFSHWDVVHPDSGGIGVTGIASNGGDRVEFNCIFDDNLNIQDTAINALSGGRGGTKPKAPAGGGHVSKGNLKAYCRGEAAGRYGTRPAYVHVDAPQEAHDKSWYVMGIADLGSEGPMEFQCNYSAKGKFEGLQELQKLD